MYPFTTAIISLLVIAHLIAQANQLGLHDHDGVAIAAHVVVRVVWRIIDDRRPLLHAVEPRDTGADPLPALT
jgi:cytochrome b561